MARPRNNVMRLAPDARLLVARLLDEGQTYDAIRADPEVAQACVAAGVALHNNSFLAYSATPEYQSYIQSVRKYADDLERRRMAALFVSQEAGCDSIAKVANYELLRIVLDKLEHSEELESKELASISTALAAFNRNQIAAEKDKKDVENQAKISEMQSKIDALNEEVSRLRIKNGESALVNVIDEMDRFVKGE